MESTIAPTMRSMASSPQGFESRGFYRLKCPQTPSKRLSRKYSCPRDEQPTSLSPEETLWLYPNRRAMLLAAMTISTTSMAMVADSEALVQGYEPMPALKDKDYGKSRMTYSDYTTTDSGLQYQDLKEGAGPVPKPGQTCIVDWSGVTLGYYGRPFEARNKPRGGAFTGDDKEFFRFKCDGDPKVIPAFNEAIRGMKEGGIRRIIVPVELGYPDNDFKKAGPSPTTFSGKRALGFVLQNQGMIDKTLLFDIELIRIVD